MSNPIGIYLHIPFCISKCPYCDFYSLPYCEQNAQQYVGALLHALDTAPGKGREVDSIYFGGGTPVLLGGALLRSDTGGEPGGDDPANPAAAARGRIQPHLDGGAVGIGPGVANFGAAAQL